MSVAEDGPICSRGRAGVFAPPGQGAVNAVRPMMMGDGAMVR